MSETLFQILLALRAGERQAAEVLEALRDTAGESGLPSLAVFYRTLKVAIDEGWIEIVGADASGPGRPRQIYQLTPFGRRALEKEARRLKSLAALALS